MTYPIGCECRETIHFCGERARVCNPPHRVYLVTHCEDLCLPVERVCCPTAC